MATKGKLYEAKFKGRSAEYCFNCKFAYDWCRGEIPGEVPCERLKMFLGAGRAGGSGKAGKAGRSGKAGKNSVALCKKICENFEPFCSINRLKDGFGMKGVCNIADFYAFSSPNFFYIELKSIKRSALPLRNITDFQLKSMLKAVKNRGVIGGVLVWFYELKGDETDKCFWIDIETIRDFQDRWDNGGRASITVEDLTELSGQLKQNEPIGTDEYAKCKYLYGGIKVCEVEFIGAGSSAITPLIQPTLKDLKDNYKYNGVYFRGF